MKHGPCCSTLGIDTRSSDYRTNYAADKPTIVREEILKWLISSESILDVYFFDQYKYLESHLKAPGLGLEQDSKYFWIFHSLDYGKWAQRCGEAKILGLHGPSTKDLELAASYIVQSLRVNRGVMSNRCKATTNNRTVKEYQIERIDNNPYTTEYI